MRRKNLFFVLLSGLLFVDLVYANAPSDAPMHNASNLFVSINNQSKAMCQLLKKTVIHGKSIYSTIPSTLYTVETGENNDFFMQAMYNFAEKSTVTELALEYACGAQKRFSLYLKNFQKAHCKHRTTTVKFVGDGVTGEYKNVPGGVFCIPTPKYVHCVEDASQVHLTITEQNATSLGE